MGKNDLKPKKWFAMGDLSSGPPEPIRLVHFLFAVDATRSDSMTVHFHPKWGDAYRVTKLARYARVDIVHLCMPTTLTMGKWSFKCKLKGKKFSTQDWERDQGMPVMSHESKYPDRYMCLSSGDIYLGSVLHSTFCPGRHIGIPNERVAALVATALRWFSDRPGLLPCIQSLCQMNGSFQCPCSRPLFSPPPPGIKTHYSLSDALALVQSLDTPLSEVGDACLYLGFDIADLFAAPWLPVCQRGAARGLDSRKGIAGLQKVSLAGLKLYLAVVRQRVGSKMRMLEDVHRMLTLPREGKLPPALATQFGVLVAASHPSGRQELSQLRSLIGIVPSAFWNPLMKQWSTPRGMATGLSFVAGLPSDHPSECATILDAAEAHGLYSSGWPLHEVLHKRALWEGGDGVLLNRIDSVKQLRVLKERVPLRVVTGCDLEDCCIDGPVEGLLTSLGLVDSLPAFEAAFHCLTKSQNLLHILQEQHRHMAVVGGVFTDVLGQCVDLVMRKLRMALLTTVIDIPGLLEGSDTGDVIIIGQWVQSTLFHHFVSHSDLSGIGVVVSDTESDTEYVPDDSGVETPDTDYSTSDPMIVESGMTDTLSTHSESASDDRAMTHVIDLRPVLTVSDLVTVAHAVQDIDRAIRARSIEPSAATLLAAVPLPVLERHIEEVIGKNQTGQYLDTLIVYVRVITAIPHLESLYRHITVTFRSVRKPLSHSVRKTIDRVMQQVGRVGCGTAHPDKLCTPLASALSALCHTPHCLSFFECAAGEAKEGMAFAAKQADSTAHLLNQLRHRGAGVPISVISGFTWLIADASSPMFILKAKKVTLLGKLGDLARVDFAKSEFHLRSVHQYRQGLRQLIDDSHGTSQRGLNHKADYILSQGFLMVLTGDGPSITVGDSAAAQKWDVHDVLLLKNQIIFSANDDPAPSLLVLLLKTAQDICEKEAAVLVSLTGREVRREVRFPGCVDAVSSRGLMVEELKGVRRSILEEIERQRHVAEAKRRDSACAYMTTRDILSCERRLNRHIHRQHFADPRCFSVSSLATPISLRFSAVTSVIVTEGTVLDTVQALCRSAPTPIMSVRNVHLGSGESTVEDIRALVAHASLFPSVCHVVALPSHMPQGVQAEMRQCLLGETITMPREYGPIVLCDVAGSTASSFPRTVVDSACMEGLAKAKAADLLDGSRLLLTSTDAGMGKTTEARRHLGPDSLRLHISGPAKYSTLCTSLLTQFESLKKPYDLHIDIGRPLGDGQYSPGQWVAESAVFSLCWLGGLRGQGAIVHAPSIVAVELAIGVSNQVESYSAILGVEATLVTFPTTQTQFLEEFIHAPDPSDVSVVSEESREAYKGACALYALANYQDVPDIDETSRTARVDSVLAHAYNAICARTVGISWAAFTAVLLSLKTSLERIGRCPQFSDFDGDQLPLEARAEVIALTNRYAKQYGIDAVAQTVQCQRTVIENGTRRTPTQGETPNECRVGYSNLRCPYIVLDSGDAPIAFSNSAFRWPAAYESLLSRWPGHRPTTERLTASQLKTAVADFCLGPAAAGRCSRFQSSVASYEFTPDVALKMCMLHTKVSTGQPVLLTGDGGTGKTALVTSYLEMMMALAPEGTFGYTTATVNASTSEETIEGLFSDMSRHREGVSRDVLFLDEVNASPFSTEIMAGVLSRQFRGHPFPPSLSVVMAVNPLRTCHQENAMLHSMRHTVPYVFRVNPIPESMLRCLIDFGSLALEDEVRYVLQILGTAEDKYPSIGISQGLLERVVKTHHAAKQESRGYSFSVSLRDINRFVSLLRVARVVFAPMIQERRATATDVEAFVLHLTYVLRIPDPARRVGVLQQIGPQATRSVSVCQNECMGWLDEVAGTGETSDVTGMVIARNRAYSENAPALLMCVWAKVPIIIIGEPGTSKSLALRVCFEFLASAKSHTVYPTRVEQTVYQGTTQSTTSGVDSVYREVLGNVPEDGSSALTSLFVFDELGRAAQAPGNPLKSLHSILEPHGGQDNLKFAFIGLSNHSIDSAPTSRALVVYRLGTNDGLAATVRDILRQRVSNRQAHALADAHCALSRSMNHRLGRDAGRSIFGLRDVFFLAHRALAEGDVGVDNPHSRAATLVARCYSIGYARERGLACERMVRATESILSTLNEGRDKGLFRDIGRLLRWGKGAERVKIDPVMCTGYQAMRDALLDTHECSRYLLVQTESPDLIVEAIQRDARVMGGDSRGIDVLSGSQFEGDSDIGTSIETLSALIEGARRGRVVVLVHQQKVLDCLYDMLNKNYARFSHAGVTTTCCRVSLGNCADSFVPVAPSFKLVVCLSAAEVADEEPALLQRLEKVRLDIHDMGEVAESAKAELMEASTQEALAEVHACVHRLGTVSQITDGLLWLHSCQARGESILPLAAHLVPPILLLSHTLKETGGSADDTPESALLDGSLFHGCIDVLDFLQMLLRHKGAHMSTCSDVPVVLYKTSGCGTGDSVDDLVSAGTEAGISISRLVASENRTAREFQTAVDSVPHESVIVCSLGSRTEFVPQCQAVLRKREGLSVIAVDNTSDTNSICVGVTSGVCAVDCLVKPQYLPVSFNPEPVLTLSDTHTSSSDLADQQLRTLIQRCLQRSLHQVLAGLHSQPGQGFSQSSDRARDLSHFVFVHQDKIASLCVPHARGELLRVYGHGCVLSAVDIQEYTSLAEATQDVVMSSLSESLVPVIGRLAYTGLLEGDLDPDPSSAGAREYAEAVMGEIATVVDREGQDVVMRDPSDESQTVEEIRTALHNTDLRYILAPLIPCDLSTTPTLLIHAVRTTLCHSLVLPDDLKGESDAVVCCVGKAVEVLRVNYQHSISRDTLPVITKIVLCQLSLDNLSVSTQGLLGSVTVAMECFEQDTDAIEYECLSQMLVRGITYMGSEYCRFDNSKPSGALALTGDPDELHCAVRGVLGDEATPSQTIALMQVGQYDDTSYMSVCSMTPPTTDDTLACEVFTARLCGEIGPTYLLSDDRQVDAGLGVMISHHTEQMLSQDNSLFVGPGSIGGILTRVTGTLQGDTLTIGWSVAAAVLRHCARQARDATGCGMSPKALSLLFSCNRLCQLSFVWHYRQGREGETERVERGVAEVLGRHVAATLFTGSYAERYPMSALVDWALHCLPAFGAEGPPSASANRLTLFRRHLVNVSSGSAEGVPGAVYAMHRHIGMGGMALLGEVAGWNLQPGSLVHAVATDPGSYLLPFEWLNAVYAENTYSRSHSDDTGKRTRVRRCGGCGLVVFIGNCGEHDHTAQAGGYGYANCPKCKRALTESRTKSVDMDRQPRTTVSRSSVFYKDGVQMGFVYDADTVPPCEGTFPFTSHMRTSPRETVFVRCVLAALHLQRIVESNSVSTLSLDLRKTLVDRVNQGVKKFGDRLLSLVRRTAPTIQEVHAASDVCARYRQEVDLIKRLQLSARTPAVVPPSGASHAPVFPLTPSQAVESGQREDFIRLLAPQEPGDLRLGEGYVAHIGGETMATTQQAEAWCGGLAVLPQVLSLPRTVLRPLQFIGSGCDTSLLDQPLTTVLESLRVDMTAVEDAFEAWNVVSRSFSEFQHQLVINCSTSVDIPVIVWQDVTLGQFLALQEDITLPARAQGYEGEAVSMGTVLMKLIQQYNAICQSILQELGVEGVNLHRVSASAFSQRNLPPTLDVQTVEPVAALSHDAAQLLSGVRVLSGMPALVLIDEDPTPLEMHKIQPRGCLQWVQDYEEGVVGDMSRPVPPLPSETVQTISDMPRNTISRTVGACAAAQDAVSTLARVEDATTPLREFLDRWGVTPHVSVLAEYDLVGIEVRQVLRLASALQARLDWDDIVDRVQGEVPLEHWTLTKAQRQRLRRMSQTDTACLGHLVKVLSFRVDQTERHNPAMTSLYCTAYEEDEGGEAVCRALDTLSFMSLVAYFVKESHH
ncbi:hypothetical protein KIPB_004330 [Kipferlia bialata]|uniref:AAA+ ATPase domain-containing protein n=1 Tax=Kipferlia bialata TaxID=797122 RepID=A0A9K3CV84_9EUKA|nr:hypothetical protein KIPB_004330 [Kipferlia bialata]|eukprot:g4330.t1